jgi:hypothetical protein
MPLLIIATLAAEARVRPRHSSSWNESQFSENAIMAFRGCHWLCNPAAQLGPRRSLCLTSIKTGARREK